MHYWSKRQKVIDNLKIEVKSLFKWFSDNQMKANPERYHLLISSTSQREIKVDNKLRLNAHVENLCKKVSRKIHALAWVTPYMTVSKRSFLMNTFYRSQFSYCPLLRMIHSRTFNIKMSILHKRCLRTVCNDKLAIF